MDLCKEIFNRYKVDKTKLIDYGFILENKTYNYTKKILNNSFKFTLEISNDIKLTVIDLEFMEEYTNYKLENVKGYANTVKEELRKNLLDIRDVCFKREYFIYPQTNRITDLIIKKYGSYPEFLWEKFKGYGVFRKNNDKWFSIIMNINKEKLGINETLEIEIINVKVREKDIDDYLKKKGIFMAYHMSKKNWISIILDDTLSDEEILKYIDNSYNIVGDD